MQGQGAPSAVTKDEYNNFLASVRNEQEFQVFLENNTEYIPSPALLNHDVVDAVVFAKVPLFANQCIPDLTYATKSTVEFVLCHLELENPSKRIFSEFSGKIVFSSEFNRAIGQVEDWKVRLSQMAQDEVIYLPFFSFMATCHFRREFGLIYGRSAELNTPHRRALWANRARSSGIFLRTADSIWCSGEQRIHKKLNVIGKKQDKFLLKRLNTFATNMFSHIGPEMLDISSADYNRLEAEGFDMVSWRNGHKLRFNGRSVWFN